MPRMDFVDGMDDSDMKPRAGRPCLPHDLGIPISFELPTSVSSLFSMPAAKHATLISSADRGQ